MNWKDIIVFISTFTLFIPVILVIVLKLYRSKCFVALAVYYFMDLSFNLMNENYIPVSDNFRRVFGITTNLLEFPLMILFVSYFSFSPVLTKRLRYSILGIILFELIIVLILGFNRKSMTIIMAPELGLLLFLCVWFTLRHIRIAVIQNKGLAKASMITSLLFAYGSYTIIYIFFYILDSQEIKDIFNLYYFTSTFSTLVLSTGIFFESKRIKKLEELKLTRRELNNLYSKSQPATSMSFNTRTTGKSL